MNIILLTAFIFTVALTHGDKVPCSERSSSYQYQNFVQQHIVHDKFDRNSEEAWSRYLRNNGLWCRTETQTFMENRDVVERICSSAGRRLVEGRGEGNLCMSQRNILQHVITCSNDQVTEVYHKNSPVIVACNNVDNVCRPVHFQEFRNQMSSDYPCTR